MAFIIPDNILDSLTCNSCNRYLSVKPVKIYPDKQVKCGRCTIKKDEGVVSIYSVLADHSLFKCINRFDGCSRLLTYSEVRSHEETCKGKLVTCPTCINSTNFPTYAIPKHFQKRHPEEYLGKKWFIAKFDASYINKPTTFLYREDSLLFFVSYEYDHYKHMLKLNVAFLGDTEKARHIQHRFIIFNDYEVRCQTKFRPCTSYYSNSNFEYTFQINTNDLKLESKCMLEFDLNLIDIAGLIPVPCLEPLRLPAKKLSLNNKTAANILSYKISSIGTSIIKVELKGKQRIIYPYCDNCGYFEWLTHYEQGAFKTVETFLGIRSYYYCFFCCQQFKTVTYQKIEDILPLEIYQLLEVHCKWRECDFVLSLPDMQKHETICSHQPPRTCPAKSCMFFGKLVGILQHFKRSHKSVTLQLSEPLVTITSKTNTPQVHCVLVCDKFVWLEHFWKDSVLNMSVRMCDSDDDNIQPVAKLFDLNNTYLCCSHNGNMLFENKLKMIVKIELKKFKVNSDKNPKLSQCISQ